jgi:predicted Zn-dependent peptidase
MEYQTFTFKNGIRLIHHQTATRAAHLGIFINAGSRDEIISEQGMAHFIEHTLFKGTRNRNAYQVISRLEDVGGDLDAYTTKEETCIYATFLDEDYDRALELLCDIVFNPTFPAAEIEKEKLVVLDEINSYKDNPSELIFDDYDSLVYKNHSLGKNILGKASTLKRFRKADILNFIANNYATDEIVISSVGNIGFDKLKKLTGKYVNHVPTNKRKNNRIPCKIVKPVLKTVQKKTFQAHCIMGNIAYDVFDKNRIGLILLNNILAGNNMNSRLNMVLREKHGYAYNVESSYTPYTDTGLLTIYFGTDKMHLNKCMDLVYIELQKLREKKLTGLQLSNSKKQITGQITISSESNSSLMITLAKSYLLYNKVESLKDLYKRIEKISSSDLLEIANEILDQNKITTLIYN